MTTGDSGQPPLCGDRPGPGEELTQGCTDPQPVRQRYSLCILSTPLRDRVSHQAWVLGEVRVLPWELASPCEEAGHAEAPTGKTSRSVAVRMRLCVCTRRGQGASFLKSLLRGQPGRGWGVSLPTLLPQPCGSAGCGLNPFTSPNVTVPWGLGGGWGPVHTGQTGVQPACQDSLGLRGPAMGAGSESGSA